MGDGMSRRRTLHGRLRCQCQPELAFGSTSPGLPNVRPRSIFYTGRLYRRSTSHLIKFIVYASRDESESETRRIPVVVRLLVSIWPLRGSSCTSLSPRAFCYRSLGPMRIGALPYLIQSPSLESIVRFRVLTGMISSPLGCQGVYTFKRPYHEVLSDQVQQLANITPNP